MSDAPMDRHAVSSTSVGEAIIYRAVFSILFSFSVLALVATRLVGRRGTGTVWAQAKQAAHATLGYAVKY